MPFDGTSSVDPVGRLFIDVADQIRRGWHQGFYHDGNGNVCLAYAILCAATDGHVLEEAMRQIYLAISDTPCCCSDSRDWYRVVRDVIAIWNDSPGRTQEEVLELCNRFVMLPVTAE